MKTARRAGRPRSEPTPGIPSGRNETALARAGDLTREQIDLVKRTVAVGATDDELALFLYQCKRLGLDPLSRQIHFVRRWDSRAGREVGAIQTGIDGLRLIAARTGRYRPDEEPPRYTYDDTGKVRSARVRVWVYHEPTATWHPVEAEAYFDEYAQRGRDGTLFPNWARMPRVMTAKCFSEDTEILTDRGFQRFDRVTGRILQVTDHGLEPIEAVPFVQTYAGRMITLESDDLNFSVTPNHDMITTIGKLEAEQLYELARSRPRFWIPRCVLTSRPEAPYTDTAIRLAAAFLADGIEGQYRKCRIEVSRERKIRLLEEIGGFESRRTRESGDIANTPTRTIVTQANKTCFIYPVELIRPFIAEGKRPNIETLLTLSLRQARLFVDTWVAFDGHTQSKTGVRRVYSSREDHLAALEVACIAAGYSVSQRKARWSDISTKPNWSVTISSRSEIPVVRHGRPYRGRQTNNSAQTSIAETTNISGRVWCVTVPSGVIVVRRHGFSMLCGNCAEALALRKAFPAELSGVYELAEIGGPVEPAELPASTAQAETGSPGGEQPNGATPEQREAIHRVWHARTRGRFASHDASEAALDAWLRFQAGVESTQALTFAQAAQAINALQRASADELIAVVNDTTKEWTLASPA